jgi:hypothetical protein
VIRYSDIEGLPDQHPLVNQFNAQCDDHQTMMEALTDDLREEKDESSLCYFNKYIAGDRK